MAVCNTVYLCLPKLAMFGRDLAGNLQSEPLYSLVSVRGKNVLHNSKRCLFLFGCSISRIFSSIAAGCLKKRMQCR